MHFDSSFLLDLRLKDDSSIKPHRCRCVSQCHISNSHLCKNLTLISHNDQFLEVFSHDLSKLSFAKSIKKKR